MCGASLDAPGRLVGEWSSSGARDAALCAQPGVYVATLWISMIFVHQIKLAGDPGGLWPWLAVSSALALANCGVRGR